MVHLREALLWLRVLELFSLLSQGLSPLPFCTPHRCGCVTESPRHPPPLHYTSQDAAVWAGLECSSSMFLTWASENRIVLWGGMTGQCVFPSR